MVFNSIVQQTDVMDTKSIENYESNKRVTEINRQWIKDGRKEKRYVYRERKASCK